LPGAALVTVHQVHSAEAVIAHAPFPDDARPPVDAIVTDRPGLLLGILTADCAPVLLADAQAGVVGAAHAGWKGALHGVTDATIAAMEKLGAKREHIVAAIGPCIARASYEVDDAFARRFEEADPANELGAKREHIVAAIGPCIARASYEVDDAFARRFEEADPANERFFFAGRPGHQQFDIEAYVAARLAAAGVGRVAALGLDTYADEAAFFSFRRATHRGEPDYGREISLIGVAA